MNKSALKTYAQSARKDFIAAVTAQASLYGISKEGFATVKESGEFILIEGRPFPRSDLHAYGLLKDKIQKQGFEASMEEAAYSWFNRLVAIRFMELHGYFDHGLRVLSHPDPEKSIPEILEKAELLDWSRLDKQKVLSLKLEGTKDAELYRYLLLEQCHQLHEAMPFLFEFVGGATELLLSENLLHTDSNIRKMIREVDASDWQEVEIVGWLYQYYISEKKDAVIGKVVKSEDIPAATQLFTPKWIVQYLVQNTLGSQWMATYPQSGLKAKMTYYIPPGDQTPEVQAEMDCSTPKSLNPEELTLLDPACGSGHILVEAYDLFREIYLERGYLKKEIPTLILEKNLFGLEIDERAAQLAGFALMMKAREDDRQIFTRRVIPKILCFSESGGIHLELLGEPTSPSPFESGDLLPEINAQPLLGSRPSSSTKSPLPTELKELVGLFAHAKTFGSLITIPDSLTQALPILRQWAEVRNAEDGQDLFISEQLERILKLIEQAEYLSRKYDAVVANPPYMGSKGMNPLLSTWAKEVFPDSKSDLFAMFIERGLEMILKNGYSGMVTMQSWMFLSSYEKLREKLLDHATIECMAHMANMVMGIAFGTSATIWRNSYIKEYKGAFCFVEYEDMDSDNKPKQFPPLNERNLQAARRVGK